MRVSLLEDRSEEAIAATLIDTSVYWVSCWLFTIFATVCAAQFIAGPNLNLGRCLRLRDCASGRRQASKVFFWTKDVNFAQTCQNNGDWRLPASNHSLTNAQLFGLADLTIEYSNYDFSKPLPTSVEIAAR